MDLETLGAFFLMTCMLVMMVMFLCRAVRDSREEAQKRRRDDTSTAMPHDPY